jgi:L-lactate dehydrogenase complex protein LldE
MTGQPVALFPTCVVDTVAADVGMAAVRVLRRAGYDVSVPQRATCCGQPAWNSGFADAAAEVAATTLDALDAVPADTPICVPAGSCATMIRVFWPELFHVVGDRERQERATGLGPRVKEFSELLGASALGSSLSESEGSGPKVGRKVAYHHSCHMLRELGLRQPPLDALESIGAETVEWKSDDRCCGFGGLFSVKQPEMSVAMADDKIDDIVATDADVLVGCDQSCLMHLEGRMRRRNIRTPVRHLAQVLDEALSKEALSKETLSKEALGG